MTNVLTFKCLESDGEPVSLIPLIDGRSLIDLVTDFERENGYDDPAGGYAGIVPDHYRLGPLPTYFLGKEKPVEGRGRGSIYALFCACGEAGCWPLVAHVRAKEDRVVWERFGQSHRPERDYRSFGPFEFDRSEYDSAVGTVARFGDSI